MIRLPRERGVSKDTVTHLDQAQQASRENLRPEMSEPQRRCRVCGAAIPPNHGRGHPRKFCTACVPSGIGKEAIRAWRAVNPERVQAYNASRRARRRKEGGSNVRQIH
jgi:hypothetical protein